MEKILFLLFFLALSIKVPSVPFHLWLPKAHVEAPTTGSVLLAGILLKLGSYGFIRFLLFLFPMASFYFLPLILAIAVISVILASFTVLRQSDLKRIIAYSSVAHMNFLAGAIFVQNLIALTGSLLLQIAHGLSSSALFLTIGMLYDRYKSRNIFYYSGLVTIMPLFSFFFFIFSLANLGFPSTVNFISEMLIFIGIFQTNPSVAILTLSGVFFSAAYSFVLLTRLAFGPASRQIQKFYDLTRREFYTLVPFGILIFLLGLFPSFLTSYWTYNLVTWFIHNDITEVSFAFSPMLLTFGLSSNKKKCSNISNNALKFSVYSLIVPHNELLFWHVVLASFLIIGLNYLRKNFTLIKSFYYSQEYYFFLFTLGVLLFFTSVSFLSPRFSFIFFFFYKCNAFFFHFSI